MANRNWCPGWDLNPHSACAKKDFKSFASADFATRALLHYSKAPGRKAWKISIISRDRFIGGAKILQVERKGQWLAGVVVLRLTGSYHRNDLLHQRGRHPYVLEVSFLHRVSKSRAGYVKSHVN